MKKNLKFTIFFSLFFLTNLAQTNYEFFGAVKLNGNDKTIITYRLVFEEFEGKITGFSITDLDGAHETKNLINGSYDKKKKIFTFEEKEIIYTKSKFDESAFCFVHFTGNVKLVDNTSKVEGSFKGLFKNKTKCIDGTLSLIGSHKIYNLANKVNKKIQKSKKVDEQSKEKFNPVKVLDSLKINKLTKDQNLTVFWEAKKATIEIYDLGQEDGDIITLYLNEKIILENYKIKNEKKIVTVPLNFNEKNEFRIVAVNEGTIAPNTAKIVLIDSNRTFELLSSFKKQEQAKITLVEKRN